MPWSFSISNLHPTIAPLPTAWAQVLSPAASVSRDKKTTRNYRYDEARAVASGLMDNLSLAVPAAAPAAPAARAVPAPRAPPAGRRLKRW